jgi:hypothetical protein
MRDLIPFDQQQVDKLIAAKDIPAALVLIEARIVELDEQETQEHLEALFEYLHNRRALIAKALEAAAGANLLHSYDLAVVHYTMQETVGGRVNFNLKSLLVIFTLAAILLGGAVGSGVAQEATAETTEEDDRVTDESSLTVAERQAFIEAKTYFESSGQYDIGMPSFTQELMFSGSLRLTVGQLENYYKLLSQCPTGPVFSGYMLYNELGQINQVLPVEMGCERSVADLTMEYGPLSIQMPYWFGLINGAQRETIGVTSFEEPVLITDGFVPPLRSFTDGSTVRDFSPLGNEDDDRVFVYTQEQVVQALMDKLRQSGLCAVIPPVEGVEGEARAARTSFSFRLGEDEFIACVEPSDSSEIDVVSRIMSEMPQHAEDFQRAMVREDDGSVYLNIDGTGQVLFQAAGYKTTVFRTPHSGEGAFKVDWGVVLLIVAVVVSVLTAFIQRKKIAAWWSRRESESQKKEKLNAILKSLKTLKVANWEALVDKNTPEFLLELKQILETSKQIGSDVTSNLIKPLLPAEQAHFADIIGAYNQIEKAGSLTRKLVEQHIRQYEPDPALEMKEYNKQVDAYRAKITEIRSVVACSYVKDFPYKRENTDLSAQLERFAAKEILMTVAVPELELEYYGLESIGKLVDELQERTEHLVGKTRSPFVSSREEIVLLLKNLYDDNGNFEVIRTFIRTINKRAEFLETQSAGGSLITIGYKLKLGDVVWQLLAYRDLADNSLSIVFGPAAETSTSQATDLLAETEARVLGARESDTGRSIAEVAAEVSRSIIDLLALEYYQPQKREQVTNLIAATRGDSRVKKVVIREISEWLAKNLKAVLHDEKDKELAKLVKNRMRVIAARLYDYLGYALETNAQQWEAFVVEAQKQMLDEVQVVDTDKNEVYQLAQINYASAAKEWLTATSQSLFARIQIVEAIGVEASNKGKARLLVAITRGHKGE